MTACCQLRLECDCDTAYWNIPAEDKLCVGQQVHPAPMLTRPHVHLQVHCIHKVAKDIGSFDTVLDTLSNTTRTCLAACETTYYNDVTVSTSSFPNMETFMETEHSCTIAKKLVSLLITILQSNALHCLTAPYSPILQCSSVPHVHCPTALNCSAVPHTAVQCSAPYCSAV